MAQIKITKRAVDAAQPGEKPLLLWDDELRGFGLKVTPAGKKVYIFQYRMGGRSTDTRRYTIGTHGAWTPSAAREHAEEMQRKVRKGIDPNDEKVERNRQAVDLAFNAYAAKFVEEYAKQHWKASHDFAESALRIHVTPVLKSKPLPAIRLSDITAVLDRIPAKQPALRRNVYAVMRRLFRWAVGRGDILRSPLDGAEAPPLPQSRDRVLSDDELRLAWNCSGDLGYPFGSYYRLLILTGQRREEVAGLEWRELDRASAEWKLPGERSKNSEAQTIHLSALAIAELDKAAGGDKWPKRGLVFTTTGKTAVSGYSRAKKRLDALMLAAMQKSATKSGDDPKHVELAKWRTHDLRRTLATGMQRLGIRFEVTEALLNHVSGARAGVGGIYQRHHWGPEKKAAWEAWSAHVAVLLVEKDETNVVALPERAA